MSSEAGAQGVWRDVITLTRGQVRESGTRRGEARQEDTNQADKTARPQVCVCVRASGA